MEKPGHQPAPPAPEPPTERKLRMESEKLQAEIEAIRRPLYKTPSFYTAMSPVILATLGVIFTWASGWFDTQRKSIEADKKLLTIETKELEQKKRDQQAVVDGLNSEKSVLTAQIAEMQIGRGELRHQLQQLVNEKVSFTNQIALLENERNEMRLAKEAVEAEARRLAGSETNAIAYLAQLKELQIERQQVQQTLKREKILNAVKEMDMRREYFASLYDTAALLKIKNPSPSDRSNLILGIRDRIYATASKDYDHWLTDDLASATNVPPSWQHVFNYNTFGEANAIVEAKRENISVEDYKAREAKAMKAFEQYIEEARARRSTNN